MDAEAGRQFEGRVRAAMAAAEVPSLSELARSSGIKTQVWYSWFRGEKQPRANSLRLAAQALGTTPAALTGEAPVRKQNGEAPMDLAAAIAAQTAALNALVMEIRALVPHHLENRLAVVEGRIPVIEGELRELRGLAQALHPELPLVEQLTQPVPRGRGE